MKLVKGDNGNSDFGWIGRGVEINGDIVFADRLQVDGKVIGKLASESGTLVIGESGQIEAQVDVGICVIHGALHGNLIARSKVEIRKSGRVHGDVIAPVLLVEEGALFNGAIKMGQEAGRKLEEVLTDDSDNDGRRRAKGA
ncbi:MAG TPA: polymer-forming cytoskeletal protein [Blastocatellia bacterium]|nr:polymer-forming cytoskeletal protein [Blastocatellia bacterium]